MQKRIGLVHSALLLAWLIVAAPAWGAALTDDPPPAEVPPPEAKPVDAEPPGPKAPDDPQAPSNADVPRDRSLPPADYARLGMPPVDRLWMAADMTKAVRALAAVMSRDAAQLPRFDSDRSREVFARLTAEPNLHFYQDKSLSVNAQAAQAAQCLEASSVVLAIYLTGFEQKATGDREVVECFAAEFRQMAVTLDLFDELFAGGKLPEDDAAKKERGEAIEQMWDQMENLVSGGFAFFSGTDKVQIRVAERARLAGYLGETFPQIIPRLPQVAQAEAIVRLEMLAREPNAPALQPALGKLDEAVRSAMKAKKPAEPRR